MNQAPVVNYTNYTISQLQGKLRELTDKMRLDYTLNTKMVTAIIPGREAEGPVSVMTSWELGSLLRVDGTHQMGLNRFS